MSVEVIDFYPRPPGGGRPRSYRVSRWLRQTISIHALRVEGDNISCAVSFRVKRFLSTPSGWRATASQHKKDKFLSISIHALRVEGDRAKHEFMSMVYISIHALRVEGDKCCVFYAAEYTDFYPRPPGGGRPCPRWQYVYARDISIHALRVEGDPPPLHLEGGAERYFYPRPPGGGRPIRLHGPRHRKAFLSTPSGWRATFDLREPTAAPEIFLSTPSGWRATP